MVKIYTRTGDDGRTHLFGGDRVSKNHPRVRAYGAVDEVNSQIGVVRALCDDDEICSILQELQSLLFICGADLASPEREMNPEDKETSKEESGSRQKRIHPSDTEQLESWIDHLSNELPELQHFILPGETPVAARLQFCRSLCRRAERAVVDLVESEEKVGECLPFLNRLSDLLFALARVHNHRSGEEEIPWEAPLS